MANYQPINPDSVSGWYWQAPAHYLGASELGHLSLSPTEVYPAACVMPVAFSRRGKRMEPVAIVGQQADVNLFVGPKGQWLGRYVPGMLRHPPFELVATGSGESALCVDLDSEWLSRSEGEAFFDGNEPSAALQGVLAELKRWKGERASPMRAMMDALEAHELLRPWPLTFTAPDGREIVHEGLYQIDTDRLNGLNGGALEALHRIRVLPMIYAHRLSTFHLHLLDRLAAAHANWHRTHRSGIPDKWFGDRGDEFTFDFDR